MPSSNQVGLKKWLTFDSMLKAIVVVIYLQTLPYKLGGHPDSINIFTQLGVEPFGRIALGVFELITVILILIPKTQLIGMLLSLGLMIGALVSHLIILGVEVNDDGGGLFILAVITFISTIIFLIRHQQGVQGLFGKAFRTFAK